MKTIALSLAGLFGAAVAVGGETLTLPAAASILGASPFYSDVRAFNISYTSSLTVTAAYRCFIPTSCLAGTPQIQFTLGPREARAFDDMVASTFQAPHTAGGVEFTFDGPAEQLVVTSRLYSTAPRPTVGMLIPGMRATRAYTGAVLTSIRHDPIGVEGGFRANVGAFNPGDEAVAVVFTIFVGGASVGTAVVRGIGGHSGVQVTGIFETAGVAAISTRNAVIQVSASGPIFSYAAVIDNATSDPIFVVGADDRGALPTPTRTNTGTPGTPTRTATPGNSPTPTRTSGAATPTRTFTPTLTRTAGPSPTRTPTIPTRTPSRTSTPGPPTATFTITLTPTITKTPSRTQTFTRTPSPTATVATATFTPSRTFTITLTPTRTLTPTKTLTASRTPTRTATFTGTPTRTPTTNPNHLVSVQDFRFVDSVSGNSNTTIHAGETIEWDWVSAPHSTTSGPCNGLCTPDGVWNSGIISTLPNRFTRTFPTATTFSYFCLVHGSMMQGAINVLP